MTIQLLISVRDAAEACIAVDAGADIIDVKEPAHGPLGCAGAEVIDSVVRAVDGAKPVSAALGECCQWNHELPGETSQPFPLPAGLHFAKLGLKHMAKGVTTVGETLRHPAMENWSATWMAVRDSFATQEPCAWVAVAYADHHVCESPSPEQVLKAAVGSHCKAILIDTWGKAENSVFDLMSPVDLKELRQQAQRAGLLFALAGQLRLSHIPLVHTVAPDVVGVRGAVCDGEMRSATLSPARIAELKAALDLGGLPQNHFGAAGAKTPGQT